MTTFKYIRIPKPVTLFDPDTKEPLKDEKGNPQVLSFKGLLGKIFHNPMWNESFNNLRAMRDIEEACEEAYSQSKPYIKMPQETWLIIQKAVLSPKFEMMHPTAGVQIVSGFGYHPTIASQLIPLLLPIINATLEQPLD
jgi:hypothetical protein